MFQKHSIMSLKKKSKSLGHLTALGSHPCSPDVEPKLKKNASQTKFTGVPSPDGPQGQGHAARYMKRFLSPSSQDRTPLPTKQPLLISSPRALRPETETQDKMLQTRPKTTPKKLKGVMKGKGGAGAVAMGKALISNFTPGKTPGFSGRGGESLADIFSSKDGAFVPNKHRAFLMDTQVKYTIGLQSQERNLFLFNDLLLIAKERSSSHFKLKDQQPAGRLASQARWSCRPSLRRRPSTPPTSARRSLSSSTFRPSRSFRASIASFSPSSSSSSSSNSSNHPPSLTISEPTESTEAHLAYPSPQSGTIVPLSDVWLSTCISDVSEVTLDAATSFVIGWPITNAVITFSCPEQKALWWEKLRELIATERSHSPAGASINITYFDNSTNFEHLKSIYVAISDCSRDCIIKALECLEVPSIENGTAGQFQLWVRTKLDESPYPLIGHEIPLVIKLHWMRQTFNNKNQKTYDEYRQGCRCSFILRRVGQVSSFSGGEGAGSQKKKLKKVKSSMKLQNVFRRVSQVSRGASDTVDGEDKEKKVGRLFGRPLADLCGGDGRTELPPAVASMLVQLQQKGPETVGIFRRGPNVRMMRDLRERLDEGEEVDWTEISVFVTAALLKDLLRSLPDCMLLSEDYSTWAEAATTYQAEKNIDSIKSLVERLPPANHHFLRHILYILNQTAENNQENMMTASNLSICVGPSILWSSDQAYMMDQNYSKEILIEDFAKIFGPDTPDLFVQQERGIDIGTAAGGQQQRQSSTPERQSSVPSEASASRQRSNHFDHSSLDSLLDPAFPPEDDLARQSGTEGLSLTNLSHDSGLTTSDSQLYAFEEPENSFSSDDFCIETITSKDNTVHAIVNKKFLSRYQGAYLVPGGQNLPGQGGQQPGNQQTNRKKAGQRHQKHRDRMHRRIHRNSDYGAYPASSSKPEVIEPAAYNYDVRTTKVNFPLRRTASEESVQHGSKFEIIHVNNNNRRKRPAAHRKGKAPNPPRGKTSPNIVRSNSVNQVRHWEQSMDWYRSKSTTRLAGNSEDSEESCSTLSDEDSTPHVSRSNSYGRSEDNTFNTTEEERFQGQEDTTYDIYLHDERTLELSPQTNLESAFVQNAKRGSSREGREFDSFSCETPPGYEESLYRQRLLKLHHRSSSYVAPSPVNTSVPEKIIEKQVELSAKAKAVFEESLRQYEGGGTVETPPPLPPKTERPPLPPKQRGRRSADQGEASSDDQTYVNSSELRHASERSTRSRTKLSLGSSQPHHRHNSDSGRKSSSEEKESSEFVYGSYFSGGGSTKVPVGACREETKEVIVKQAPSLPPKETRIAEVTSVETSRPMKKKAGVTSTRIVGTNVKPMKSVETQTDESDFYLLYPEGVPDEESLNNTDSEYSPESNRSISPDYAGASQYFRSPAEKDQFFLGTGTTLFERPVSAQSSNLRQVQQASPLHHRQPRRKLESVSSVPGSAGGGVHRNHNDPVIAGEINWSVSQLRTLFNQLVERRLNFHNDHLGGNYTAMYATTEPQTDSDQESYV